MRIDQFCSHLFLSGLDFLPTVVAWFLKCSFILKRPPLISINPSSFFKTLLIVSAIESVGFMPLITFHLFHLKLKKKLRNTLRDFEFSSNLSLRKMSLHSEDDKVKPKRKKNTRVYTHTRERPQRKAGKQLYKSGPY